MHEDIRQAILDWNPWLTGPFPQALLGFKRDYHLFEYLKIPEIKIIEGGRRVGKSTLLYQVIHKIQAENNHILYVNFEDEVLNKYSLAEIVYAQLEYMKPIDFLFVDEIQNCKDWVAFIRKMYDRKEIKQIWVSGSNSSLIKKEYATLLTGRNISIQIFPLSFHEFLNFKSITFDSRGISKNQQAVINKAFKEYMHYGAFPAVVNREVFKKEILLAYFDDFIYKDIVARHEVNADKVKDLALYLATNSSKIFSYRSLAAALHCHFNTIIDYLNYLKEAFLFNELYKFDYSLKKQFANDKKVYCIDTGLAGAVSFRFSEDIGRILESLVFSELKRRKKEIYFHKQKYECDFIVKEERSITQALQVCFSIENQDTKEREINGLCDALETYQLTQGLLLTLNDEGNEIIKHLGTTFNVIIMPIWKWMLKQEE